MLPGNDLTPELIYANTLVTVQCIYGKDFTRAIAVSLVANSLDMLTDLLSKCHHFVQPVYSMLNNAPVVVSIPIKLLRKVNIGLWQKIVLCIFLCLSVCMFLVSLIRAVRPTFYGNFGSTIDVQWALFWQTIEVCVAVIVVSLTSFRSLYGIKNLQQERRKDKRYDPRLSIHRRNLLGRRKQEQQQQRGTDDFSTNLGAPSESHALPAIPGRSTLTGMHTIISSSIRKSTQEPKRGDDDLLSTYDFPKEADEEQEESNAIKVVVDLETRESIRNTMY